MFINYETNSVWALQCHCWFNNLIIYESAIQRITDINDINHLYRYNPENLSTLERYVDTQARENAYDLEANLAVLKLWVKRTIKGVPLVDSSVFDWQVVLFCPQVPVQPGVLPDHRHGTDPAQGSDQSASHRLHAVQMHDRPDPRILQDAERHHVMRSDSLHIVLEYIHPILIYSCNRHFCCTCEDQIRLTSHTHYTLICRRYYYGLSCLCDVTDYRLFPWLRCRSKRNGR